MIKPAPIRENVIDKANKFTTIWTLWLQKFAEAFNGLETTVDTKLSVPTLELAITAAGTVQGDATTLAAGRYVLHEIETVAANTGVVLQTPSAGDYHIIVNRGANNLKIYPHSGGVINAQAANASVTIKGVVGSGQYGYALLWARTTGIWDFAYLAPLGADTPLAAGTASAGTFPTVSRADHVHPTKTFITPLAAQADATTTTLANIITIAVAASTTYRFVARLYVTSNIIGGHKYAIDGTCTATSIRYSINSIDNDTDSVVIAGNHSALASSDSDTSSGSTSSYTEISGVIIVANAGNLSVQFAQGSAFGTSSVLTNSHFELQQI